MYWKILINQIHAGIADSYQSEPKGVLRITVDLFWSAILATYHYQFMRKYPDVRRLYFH